MEPRREVKIFANAMEVALRANDHKVGWKDEKEQYFIDRIHEKINELESVMNTEEAKCELAADIANYAMMIFDTAVSDF